MPIAAASTPAATTPSSPGTSRSRCRPVGPGSAGTTHWLNRSSPRSRASAWTGSPGRPGPPPAAPPSSTSPGTTAPGSTAPWATRPPMSSSPSPARRSPRRQPDRAIGPVRQTGATPVVDLMPDVDYASVAAAALAGPIKPEELGSHLSRAWAQAYRSRLPQSSLLEFDSDGARFLFDLASAAVAERADRTVPAWGRSRPAPRPRDQAYQRGYPSPQGRADRPLDKGHMVAHPAGGPSGPNMFRRIASSPGDGPGRAAATVHWSGRSPTRQARSSSA